MCNPIACHTQLLLLYLKEETINQNPKNCHPPLKVSHMYFASFATFLQRKK
jgi:hypothetical protein